MLEDPQVFVFVRLHAGPDREDAVREALTKVVAASRLEPGCVRTNAFRSFRDPRLFFIHSVWTHTEAFDLHATLPHTTAFIRLVDALLDEPRQVSRTHLMV